MNDEQIIEYLRSRSRMDAPMGLSERVMAGIAAAPAHRSWFAGLLPAVATVAVVAMVAVVALLVVNAELEPSASPTPTPGASPTPAPTPIGSPPPGYVEVGGLPITVLANAAADALFSETQRCVSKAGYAVDFPAGWYTNSPTDEAPACTWFAPEPFDGSIQPVAVREHPDGIWLTLEVVDGLAGYVGETPIYMREQISIGGHDGHRAEFGPSMGGVVGTPSEERGYWYVVPFADDGPTFLAETGSDLAGDYLLAKAVLDRIVASISFDR